jgi:hypothetical protein
MMTKPSTAPSYRNYFHQLYQTTTTKTTSGLNSCQDHLADFLDSYRKKFKRSETEFKMEIDFAILLDAKALN